MAGWSFLHFHAKAGRRPFHFLEKCQRGYVGMNIRADVGGTAAGLLLSHLYTQYQDLAMPPIRPRPVSYPGAANREGKAG